jgi:putative transposase
MLAHSASYGLTTHQTSKAPEGRNLMGHSFSSLLTHVVFSTKDRRPQIDSELKERLFPYMSGILREVGAKTLIVNGPADHVHLLVRLPATKCLADVIRILKTNSSRWVHETFPHQKNFGWQTGYGAFSVSESNRDTVYNYIANQEEHHRKKSFQEEFITFLKKHGMEYEEKYLWD